MKTTHLHRAKKTGEAYAEEFYKDFLNPKMRGPKFQWKNFPEICGRMASVCVFTAFSNAEWLSFDSCGQYTIEKHAYEAAVKKATQLMN